MKANHLEEGDEEKPVPRFPQARRGRRSFISSFSSVFRRGGLRDSKSTLTGTASTNSAKMVPFQPVAETVVSENKYNPKGIMEVYINQKDPNTGLPVDYDTAARINTKHGAMKNRLEKKRKKAKQLQFLCLFALLGLIVLSGIVSTVLAVNSGNQNLEDDGAANEDFPTVSPTASPSATPTEENFGVDLDRVPLDPKEVEDFCDLLRITSGRDRLPEDLQFFVCKNKDSSLFCGENNFDNNFECEGRGIDCRCDENKLFTGNGNCLGNNDNIVCDEVDLVERVQLAEQFNDGIERPLNLNQLESFCNFFREEFGENGELDENRQFFGCRNNNDFFHCGEEEFISDDCGGDSCDCPRDELFQGSTTCDQSNCVPFNPSQ